MAFSILSLDDITKLKGCIFEQKPIFVPELVSGTIKVMLYKNELTILFSIPYNIFQNKVQLDQNQKNPRSQLLKIDFTLNLLFQHHNELAHLSSNLIRVLEKHF